MDTLDLNLIQLLLIISLFAILQSILGIGLLLFGTPTLMLLGYTYDVVLSIILPASIVISALQVMENYSIVNGKKYLFVYTLPSIGLGLYYILGLKAYIDITFIVGVMLLIIGFIRISKRLNDMLKIVVHNNKKIYCVMMGIVHGVSNMGGGLLTVYMSTLNHDKIAIRSSIAYWYLIFALVQLAVLYLSDLLLLSTDILLVMLASFISYLAVGRIASIKISHSNYQLLITFLIFTYGASCITL